MAHKRRENYLSRRVGLDVGSHTIKGVEVVERGGELVVRSVGSCSAHRGNGPATAADNGHIVGALRSLWSSAGFESKDVVLALPADKVYVKWLHLEASSREELDATARSAAVRGAPFPADDAMVEYRVLSSRGTPARNGYFVMLAAASGVEIDKLLSIAESAGLVPAAVDMSSAAAARMLETHCRVAGNLWQGQPVAHIVIGAMSTSMTMLRAGELEFARTVPVGGDDFTACIAESQQMSWAEAERVKKSPGARLVDGGSLVIPSADGEIKVPCENVVGRLAREIQRSLRFFRSQFAEGSYLGMMGSSTMSGGGALLKGLDTCLQEHGVETGGVINPFTGLSVDAEGYGMHHISDSATQYVTAVGLAIADYWSGAAYEKVAPDIAA